MPYYVKRRCSEGGRIGYVGPIRSARQARRERQAWEQSTTSTGGTYAARVLPSTPAVRAAVSDWERRVKLGEIVREDPALALLAAYPDRECVRQPRRGDQLDTRYGAVTVTRVYARGLRLEVTDRLGRDWSIERAEHGWWSRLPADEATPQRPGSAVCA